MSAPRRSWSRARTGKPIRCASRPWNRPHRYTITGGFTPHTYELTWPAPGSPQLAERIQALLGDAGIAAVLEDERGFDHGVFVPLKVMLPDADIPTLAMSLRPDLDPAFHLRLGAALAPLRDEGVLILGSGNSTHNTQGMMTGGGAEASVRFDDWLGEAVVAPGEARERALSRWEAAPDAREAHPREELPDSADGRGRRRA